MGEFDVRELAAYIQKKYYDKTGKEITPIKLQKSLYFLFAYWGGMVRKSKLYPDAIEEDFSCYSEYLFDDDFEAWVYGAVVPTVYKEKDILKFYNKNMFDGKERIKDFIDDLLNDLFETSDFTLVEACHNDNVWKNNFNYDEKFHNNKMEKEKIIEEYAKK